MFIKLKQVSDDWLMMTDYWWLIIRKLIQLRKCLIVDCLHTENAEDTEVRKRTVGENMNHRNLNGI